MEQVIGLKRKFFQLKENLTSMKKMHFSGQGSAAHCHFALRQAAGKDCHTVISSAGECCLLDTSSILGSHSKHTDSPLHSSEVKVHKELIS